MLSYKEAQQLMKDFIQLKKKFEETGSKKDKMNYDRHYMDCINKFDYIVKMRTNKYQSFSNYEDLLQEGRLALVKAMTTFNPKKGNFFGWAHHYVGTRVYRHANLHTTIRYPFKFAKDNPPRKENNLPLQIEERFCPDKKLDEKELENEINIAMNYLTEQQQEIIKLYFGFNDIKGEQCSITKIAKQLNIEREICIEELSNAFVIIKDLMKDDYCC